jgi:hypothetical protein
VAQPKPADGQLCGQKSPFTTSPNPGRVGALKANVGRIWVFLRMLSLNGQRTFDGASPRLSRPTLASGEHGAPVQGLGLVAKEIIPTQLTVQGAGLVAEEIVPTQLAAQEA